MKSDCKNRNRDCTVNSNLLRNLIFDVKGVAFNMIGVEGGSYMMGSDNGYTDEQPVHEVRVSDFWIGETEVSQGLWKVVMGDNPSYFKKGDNYPVESIVE